MPPVDGRTVSLANYERAKERRRLIERSRLVSFGGTGVPPVQRANCLHVFDPAYRGGAQTHPVRRDLQLEAPSATLGSTTGTDTNDPTLVTNADGRVYYQYGADDYLDFGNAYGSVLSGGGGWTLMMPFELVAGDLAGAKSIWSKITGTQQTMMLRISAGDLYFYASYDATATLFDDYTDSAVALTAGKYRLILEWHPAAARAVRCKAWLNGAARTFTRTGSAGDGTMFNGTAPWRTGLAGNGVGAPIGIIGPAYLWNLRLSAQGGSEIADADAWLADRGW